MRNFYSLNSSYVIDTTRYISEWEKYLDLIPDPSDENTKQSFSASKKTIQSLSSHVMSLWEKFNSARENLQKYYIESSMGHKAYIASFLLPNIERVFSVLTQDENLCILEDLLKEPKEELVIADFGSGPLSAGVGFLAVLEYLFASQPHLKIPQKIYLYAIDRSERIVQVGKKLLQPSFVSQEHIEIVWLTSPEKLPKNIDIALCANVFNELPQKHRLKTLNSLYNKLTESGLLLILEPGQQVHAKNLGTLRDAFLTTTPLSEIISPCAHKKNCPLSATVERRDWCWFKHAWNPPQALVLIDRLSKIDHHELNYSYLFLQKSRIQKNHFYARCVSDEMTMPHDEIKVLFCTETGSLDSIFYSALEENEPNYRGKRID